MIYLDNSATTAYKPESVINATVNTMRFLSANPGRSGHAMAAKAAALVYNTRKTVAAHLGCQANGIIFCYNCTDALNMAILGTATEGGHVITTAYEHNSVLRPLHELKRQGKITLTVLLPNNLGIVTADMVERAVRYNTYLIAINHISNVTGAVSPITEIGRIAKKRNILLLVDGAQSVGYTKIDMREQNIDILAVAPHKGLHAPQGIGCLALSEGIVIAPTRFGGTGTSSLDPYQPHELPEALESGTVATPAIAGLGAAVKWTEKHFNTNQSKINELSIYFWDKLKERKSITVYSQINTTNGIFSFNINDINSSEISNILSEQYQIYTRSGLHCAPLIHKYYGTDVQGMVRVSLGIENTPTQIDTLFAALSDIISFSQRPSQPR